MKPISFLICILLAFNVNAASKKVPPATVKVAPAIEKQATSVVRITCDGSDIGADVTIDGKFKGQCPLDLKIAEGSHKLQVVKAIDEKNERYFERDLRIGDDVIMKIEVVLSNWIKDDNGCKTSNSNPNPNETILWTGECMNGFISGKGKLTWFSNGKFTSSNEGEFKDGKRNGHFVIIRANGERFEADFVDGMQVK